MAGGEDVEAGLRVDVAGLMGVNGGSVSSQDLVPTRMIRSQAPGMGLVQTPLSPTQHRPQTLRPRGDPDVDSHRAAVLTP
jgi:hypothetical protein